MACTTLRERFLAGGKGPSNLWPGSGRFEGHPVFPDSRPDPRFRPCPLPKRPFSLISCLSVIGHESGLRGSRRPAQRDSAIPGSTHPGAKRSAGASASAHPVVVHGLVPSSWPASRKPLPSVQRIPSGCLPVSGGRGTTIVAGVCGFFIQRQGTRGSRRSRPRPAANARNGSNRRARAAASPE